MKEANFKIPGGKMVKVKLDASSGKIQKVQILGDFFLHPEETILIIEDALSGCPKDEHSIEKIVGQTLTDSSATLIGATASDFSKTIMMAWDAD